MAHTRLVVASALVDATIAATLVSAPPELVSSRSAFPLYFEPNVGQARGIDLVDRGGTGQLEYDFIVKPGADPRWIDLRFEVVDALDLDGRGDPSTGFPGSGWFV
ncbi:MAG: DUF7948 domain-containing protein [Thermoanaerobaculia bacterium]